jgi:insertion element IS1 protein InsB
MDNKKITCLSCQSQNIIKNGSIHNHKPKHKCKDCGRQFILNPRKVYISQETKKLIDKLLLEKISLAGISRVTGVSKKWLQDYVNSKYEKVSQEICISEKKSGKLTIQADEMWSFVGNKQQKYWLWLALDLHTKEIVGFYLGNRGEDGAKGLWQSLPLVYRQCAVCYTDFWSAYDQIFPQKRHFAVGKETGLTH